eukprot:TRINITY_DN7776_c0_g1_i5.p1 TRINITY_DN7776_c0_g1~~TRINITY_DN7776_c0_g1_i5.p1  ORF type:complete len:514 (+),score=88.03 TRINITY_DN7776_c0_g1_i5:53-1594(+)
MDLGIQRSVRQVFAPTYDPRRNVRIKFQHVHIGFAALVIVLWRGFIVPQKAIDPFTIGILIFNFAPIYLNSKRQHGMASFCYITCCNVACLYFSALDYASPYSHIGFNFVLVTAMISFDKGEEIYKNSAIAVTFLCITVYGNYEEPATKIQGPDAFYAKWFSIMSSNVLTLVILQTYTWSASSYEDQIAALLKQTQAQNEEMKLAHDTITRMSQDKQRFLSYMSHSLRTPLQALVGFSELIIQSDLTEDQKEVVAVIKFSVDSLLALVNDILDFSKLEFNAMKFHEHEFCLDEMMETVYDAVAFKAKERSVDLLFRIDQSIPQVFVGDMYRIRQVIVNLAMNSIIHSQDSKVLFEVEIQKREGESFTLLFRVVDFGVGVAPAKVSMLFQDYYQSPTDPQDSIEHSGLGLSISRRIVESMGGSIWYQNTSDQQGATFCFTCQLRSPSLEVVKSLRLISCDKLVYVMSKHETHANSVQAIAQRSGLQVILLEDWTCDRLAGAVAGNCAAIITSEM